MTAEEMLEMYYSMKDLHDSVEESIGERKANLSSYDEMYAKMKARREDIQRHRFDTEYAKKMLQKEMDRGDEISARKREVDINKSAEEQKLRHKLDEQAAREADRRREIARRNDEENRMREQAQREDEYRRRQEEEYRRREEEDYRRRRQADEEYYARLRDSGR